jgi:hypothetical protein
VSPSSTSHATDIVYEDNVAHDNGDAGFYIGESQNADARVEDNRSFANHAEGILFRDSTGARRPRVGSERQPHRVRRESLWNVDAAGALPLGALGDHACHLRLAPDDRR